MSTEYKPDSWVKLGDALNFLNGDVNWMSSGQITNVMSVRFAFLPILLLCLGVMVFIVLFLLKFCSSFCCEISCRPKITPHEDLDKIHKQIEGQISTMSKVYYTLVLGIVCASQLIAIQYENLMNGTKGMRSFVDDLNGVFNDLDDAATNLDGSTQSIAATIAGAAGDQCLSGLDSTSMTTSSGLFLEEVSPTRNVFVRLGKYLDQGLSNDTYLMFFTWGSYGLMFLFALLLGYMNYQRSTCGVKFFTLLAGIAYFVTLAMGVAFLCITMVLANTCMDPYQELLDSAPDSVAGNLAYYFTCTGEDVLLAEGRKTYDAIGIMQTRVNILKSGVCEANTDLNSIDHELTLALGYADNASESIPCPDVRDSLATFIGTSLCTQLYRFNGALWVCFQASSLFIFVLIIIGTINSQYYRSEDRRKIAANVMDLDGIIPDSSTGEDGYPQHYDLRANGGDASWGREEDMKASSKKKRRRQEAKDDDGGFY